MTVHPVVHKDHSEVGPSSIADIILCPGKVRLCRCLEKKASFAATQGTVAHAICEAILLKKPEYPIGSVVRREGFEVNVDQDMMSAVNVYTDHIFKIRETHRRASFAEGVEISGGLDWLGLPEVFGTSDYSLGVDFGTLYVCDYKHGSGVNVTAKESPQLMCYALIAAGPDIVNYEKIVLTIIQPRCKDGEAIDEWETTPSFIMAWAESVLKPTVKIALSENAPLNPGEKQCRWCAAKALCPALIKDVFETIQPGFVSISDMEPMDINSVSIEDIAAIYNKIPLISSFIKGVEAKMFDLLDSGEPVAGYKLVLGRSSREWSDERKAIEFMKTKGIEPYKTEIISPSQAEKLLTKEDKKEVSELILKKDGKPTIVKDTDKRQSITTAQIIFKDYIN